MRTVSWVLLALVGLATLGLSLVSANVAYRAAGDQIGPATLDEVAAGRPEVATALRGRRGTAAAYAAAYATLFLFIVLGPYRRGDRGSWWALLAGSLVLAARPDLVRDEVRRALPPNPASLSDAIRAGRSSFEEAGGPQAYFGDPAAATADEGKETLKILGQILADAVLDAAPASGP